MQFPFTRHTYNMPKAKAQEIRDAPSSPRPAFHVNFKTNPSRPAVPLDIPENLAQQKHTLKHWVGG
jgi:hypothetical protein